MANILDYLTLERFLPMKVPKMEFQQLIHGPSTFSMILSYLPNCYEMYQEYPANTLSNVLLIPHLQQKLTKPSENKHNDKPMGKIR